MTLKEVQSIPMKEKKFLIKEICLIYNKLMTASNLAKAQAGIVSDRGRKMSIINERTISVFNTILSLLSDDEVEIIEREFINGEKITWEMSRWSKTTYYHLKSRAIDQFIYLFFA